MTWLSVNDAWPLRGIRVWCFWHNIAWKPAGAARLVDIDAAGEDHWTTSNPPDASRCMPPTHWRPLPEPPS